MATFKVEAINETYQAVTAKTNTTTRLLIGLSDSLILTPNAAVTNGRFMNTNGTIYKTTKAKPISAWDDGEILYIKVRGGHLHKFSLANGRKIKV